MFKQISLFVLEYSTILYIKNARFLAVNFAVENVELHIYDNYGAQIHTEGRSILVSMTYKIWLKFIQWIGIDGSVLSSFDMLYHYMESGNNGHFLFHYFFNSQIPYQRYIYLSNLAQFHFLIELAFPSMKRCKSLKRNSTYTINNKFERKLLNC